MVWNWTGTGQGSYSGASSSAVVMMNGPINETAYFDVYVFHFVDQTSDIDGVADVGAHTAFEQMRNTNNIPDVLTEYGVDDGVLINAFFAYRSNSGTYTVNSLKTRSLDYSTNTLSSENELANSGFSILWVRAAKCPVRNEIIVLTQSSDAYIDMYVWNGQQWTFYSNIAFGSSTTYRCFDVAYEKTSGRALIIYTSGSTPSSPIYYRIWDGNSLSAASSIGASWGPYWGGSPYIIYDSVYGQWIEAAQAPGTRAGTSDDNEIAVAGTVYATLYVIYDPYNGGYYTVTYYLWFEAVWNGASWSTRCFETDYCNNPTGIAVTYEQQSGRAIFVANSYTAKRIYYNYWAGSFSSLSTTDITPLNTYVKYIVAKCAAGSNKILMATMDNNGYVATLLYDGSQWTIHSLHTSAAYNSRRSIDLAWSPNGASAILLYGARTSNTLYYKMFSSNSWSSEASVAMSAHVAWIQAATDPSENAYALIATLTLDNALVAYKWDSSGFSVSNTITSTCDTYTTQPFSFLVLSQAAYNYRLELEVQWLNVNVAYSKYLCIKVMDAQLSESLIVEVYNGQAWIQLATLTSGLNIIDVSAYVTPTFTIRFKDQITSGDRVQNSWRIDYAVLTSVLPRESPLNGWLYRRSFTVASSSLLNNGIVKLTVYYGGGVDSGSQVYLNGKCKSDFSDVRFTDSDGVTMLPYWRETYVASDYAVFWVKLSNVQSTTTNLYIYYGNPNAVREDKPQDVGIFSLREHKDSSYTPQMRFMKPDDTTLRLDSTIAFDSLGEAYAFITVPREFLHGKKLSIRWNYYYDYPDGRDLRLGRVLVIDAELHRAQSLPQQEIIAMYPSATVLYYPTYSAGGWNGWRVDTSGVLDLSTYTSPYVTILIRFKDAWAADLLALDIDYLQIQSSSGTVLYNFDFTGAIIMEEQSTTEDYGLIYFNINPAPSIVNWGLEEAFEQPSNIVGGLSGWGYRKGFVVGAAAGAGSGYQIKLTVYYGSGVDSGSQVYLNGKCRSDFGDVRFTDDDGVSLLSCWLQEKVDGNYAVFWVKVNDDLSLSPASLYIYYGNPYALSISDGASTFLLYNDVAGRIMSQLGSVSQTYYPNAQDPGDYFAVNTDVADIYVAPCIWFRYYGGKVYSSSTYLYFQGYVDGGNYGVCGIDIRVRASTAPTGWVPSMAYPATATLNGRHIIILDYQCSGSSGLTFCSTWAQSDDIPLGTAVATYGLTSTTRTKSTYMYTGSISHIKLESGSSGNNINVYSMVYIVAKSASVEPTITWGPEESF